jgi:hypothetical protein
MTAGLREVAEGIRRNVDRKLQLMDATEGLTAEVNRAVMALQTQDIVAQRLEHARQGLLEAEAGARAFVRSGLAGDALHAAAVLRVEGRQLASAAGDLAGAEKELEREVRAIHSHLETFDADCVTLRQFSEITASVKGTVQALLDAFGEIRKLIAETAQWVNETEGLVRPCASLAQNATNAVEEIARQMRLIALNAQIHAVKVGEGTGLEVLAAQASAISALTTGVGERSAAGAERVAGLLASSLERMGALAARCRAERERLNGEAGVEEEALHDFRDLALLEVRELGGALARAVEAGDGLLAGADCAGAVKLIGETQKAAADLERLIGRGARAHKGQLAQRAAGLKAKYSMERERTAHREALGIDAPAGGGTIAAGANGAEIF